MKLRGLWNKEEEILKEGKKIKDMPEMRSTDFDATGEWNSHDFGIHGKQSHCWYFAPRANPKKTDEIHKNGGIDGKPSFKIFFCYLD